jgi:hypothetical protein
MLNLFVRAVETGMKTNVRRVFLFCFAANANEFFYFPTMHVYCIHHAMSKNPKTTTTNV